MPTYEKFYEARKSILDILQKDLIGPVTVDEVLDENPERYYIMGKLYPQHPDSGDKSGMPNLFEENFEIGANDILNKSDNLFSKAQDDEDNPLSQSNAAKQSSAGITFTLKPGVSSFICKVSWAWYHKRLENPENPKDLKWIRNPQNWNKDVTVPSEDYGSQYIPVRDGVFLHMHWLKDTEYSQDTVTTLTLINKNIVDVEDHKETRNASIEKTMFQVQLSVESDDGIFVEAPVKDRISNDEETLEMQLLYHNYQCFGQGHGCSVEWDLHNGNHPKWVRMAFMPKYDLYQMRPVTFEDTRTFNMKFLMEAEALEVLERLSKFLDQYNDWIDENRKKISSLDKKFEATAEKNISRCLVALDRMRKSVQMLRKSAKATGLDHAPWRAFQLANKVMFMQRKQSLIKSGINKIEDKNINWYPFQLAFILHEIAGIISPEDKSRNIVDLLWFPTGGGKTEAYLGIAAFTIFLRRLRNKQDKTTVVLMRYTLRLLTMQQFERAAMMIMACNYLNQKEHISEGEIGIGLWVGNGLTPNKLADADAFLKNVQEDPNYLVKGQSGTPILLKKCPWCGKPIYPQNYRVDDDSHRMEIYCTSTDCDCVSHHFNDKGLLPIHLIDEDIYANKPTFIVSTVDKFAQLPKQDKAAALFDRDHKAPNNPPELIIQDEMHLISGPLGSMVGLYETAVNALCTTDQEIGPKIIASTATVSNAPYQIEQLYSRDYSQFPPQCLTTDDSFFAVKSKKSEKPARLYCGVMSSSTTMATALIRLQAALFFATRSLLHHNKFEKAVVDNYWTIVCYFNSIRELGNSLTQLEDDVKGRYEYLRDTKFKIINEMKNVKYPSYFTELTSRKSSDEVAEILARLEYSICDNDNMENVLDCVASTNMISVGVDVGRLGTMIVAGQPKTNSEYIQASSRVGRSNPDLVVTLYNANRSRDRSHYEQFLKYHSGMYRYVEATSLTPFSDQAVLKGVHAVFVTLCRYLDYKLQPNEGTKNFDSDSAIVQKAKSIILNRVRSVDPGAVSLVEKRLNEFINYWDERKDTYSYIKRFPKDKYYLLKNDNSGDEFSTMNSMRTVDETSGVYIFNN